MNPVVQCKTGFRISLFTSPFYLDRGGYPHSFPLGKISFHLSSNGFGISGFSVDPIDVSEEFADFFGYAVSLEAIR